MHNDKVAKVMWFYINNLNNSINTIELSEHRIRRNMYNQYMGVAMRLDQLL